MLRSASLSLLVAVSVASEFDCSAYPGSILIKKIDPTISCTCLCDTTDIGSTCWKCPEGYTKISQINGKLGCQKLGEKTVMIQKQEPLVCPDHMEGPIIETGKEAHCVERTKGECTETDESAKGIKTIWGAKECSCVKKYPITCKDLGKDTKLIEGSKGATCEYEVPSKVVTSDVKPLEPNFPGFDLETGLKPIDCPKTIPLKPSDVMCGPDTSEYIHMMMERFSEIYDKKITPPKRVECHTNCASFYSKLAECAAYECDKNRFAQSGGPVKKYVQNIPAKPEMAYFADIQGSKGSIYNALYTSGMGSPQDRFKTLASVCKNGGSSAIDATTSIQLMHKTYKKDNYAIDCRSFGKNALMAQGGIEKGSTVEECQKGCDDKVYSGKNFR